MVNNKNILQLVRCRANEHGTFGRLFVEDEFICYTLEPLLLSTNEKPRAIPAGDYIVRTDIVSPKYRFRAPYSRYGGLVPRVMDVPGFSGVLIHIGNFLKDTHGCILVGNKQRLWRLLDSTLAYKSLWNILYTKKEWRLIISQLNSVNYVR